MIDQDTGGFAENNPILGHVGKNRLNHALQSRTRTFSNANSVPASGSSASTDKKGLLLRKQGRNWHEKWCELQSHNKKLRFYEDEATTSEPELLELAGTAIRPCNEREFAFEVYAILKKTIVDRLACTSERDLGQWMEMFAHMGMIEDDDDKESGHRNPVSKGGPSSIPFDDDDIDDSGVVYEDKKHLSPGTPAMRAMRYQKINLGGPVKAPGKRRQPQIYHPSSKPTEVAPPPPPVDDDVPPPPIDMDMDIPPPPPPLDDDILATLPPPGLPPSDLPLPDTSQMPRLSKRQSSYFSLSGVDKLEPPPPAPLPPSAPSSTAKGSAAPAALPAPIVRDKSHSKITVDFGKQFPIRHAANANSNTPIKVPPPTDATLRPDQAVIATAPSPIKAAGGVLPPPPGASGGVLPRPPLGGSALPPPPLTGKNGVAKPPLSGSAVPPPPPGTGHAISASGQTKLPPPPPAAQVVAPPPGPPTMKLPSAPQTNAVINTPPPPPPS